VSRILALDTSTRWGGVALLEHDAPREPVVLAEIGVQVGESHAERLLGRIDFLLAEVGWTKRSLDAYAATRGPGSFTGIRVGLGTLRGLSLAADRPCFGVTTLEALAEAHGPASGERVPLVAAGRGELYGSRFDAAGSPPTELEAPWVASLPAVVERFAGSGACLIPAPGTRESLTESYRTARTPLGLAAAVGRLVVSKHPALRDSAPPLAPVYVRPPDVRLKRKG
jgi:tRNA threonylcarbamoyl adenosine modification protein YeaZ